MADVEVPMLKRLAELVHESKVNIRGGLGEGASAAYLGPGDMDGVVAAGRTRLAPGASIGEHPHPDTDELYLILEGHGTGSIDGEGFAVGPGDLFLIKAGQSHGLSNGGATPLVFFAVLSRKAGA
jgi:mannose-6-phosphate isomerase-like protein (cupin superfamily)